MARDKGKAKATRAPKVTAEDGTNDTPKDSCPEARAIGLILPEVKNHPELYKEVVSLLKASNIDRCEGFTGCTLTKTFNGWAAAVGKNDRPKLDFFLAVYAAYLALPPTNKTIFKQAVARHDLIEWAQDQLRRISSSTSESAATPKVSVKKEKAKDNGSHEDRAMLTSESILPSIEQPHEWNQPASATHLPLGPEQTPFRSSRALKRNSTAISEARDSGARFKMAKTGEWPRPRTTVLREASTQTDDDMANQWAIELANKLAQPGKRVFDDAIEQQTKILMDFLPGAMKRVFQQVVATEVAYQQPTGSLQAPLTRPVATDMSLARPVYQPYGEVAYSRARVLDALDDRHDGVRAADMDRLLNLGGYRLARHDQRRFYE
jgi:hypothetical protein